MNRAKVILLPLCITFTFLHCRAQSKSSMLFEESTEKVVIDSSYNEVPISLLELKYVKHLVIDFTNIEVMPDWICNMESVGIFTIMNASENVSGITVEMIIDNLSECSNIYSIVFRDYADTLDFPHRGINLPGLVHIGFRNVNLVNLHKSASNLIYLEYIDVVNSGIDWIDDEFLQMSQLKYMLLEQCNIVRLPFNSNLITNLEVLSLNRNKQIDLTDLQKFLIKNNSITELALNSCDLHTFPSSILDSTNIEILSVKENKIRHIPEITFCKKNRLKNLVLRNNLIESLPSCIGDLKDLESLDVSSNKIHAIPASLYSREDELYLTMYDNPIDKELLDSLSMLNKNISVRY